MSIITNDAYSAISSAKVYAGRVAPNVTPLWLQGQPLGQWFPIPGTSGPGAGLSTNEFSDLTIRPSDGTLFAVASGGHLNGSSNAAAQITLSADSPAWTTLRASSAATADVLYYADGRPTSRHTYHHTHYIASLDSVLLAGCRFGYGGGTPTGPGMDLFNLDNSIMDYSPRYTFPDITPWGGAGYGVVQDGAGNIWTQGGYKFTVATKVWSKPGTGSLFRYPAAYDSTLDKIFALQFDDGEGYAGGGRNAKRLDPATGNSVAITFNSSAALTEFDTLQPAYAGMQYCPLDGKFYFISQTCLNNIFVITPNTSTIWDMARVVIGGTTLTSTVLCKRMLWVDKLKGFVIQPNQTQNLHFLRIA